MVWLLDFLLLSSLFHHDNHAVLARHIPSRRDLRPSAIALSNISTTSTLIQEYSTSSTFASTSVVKVQPSTMADATASLPSPFHHNPKYSGDYKNEQNYQDVKSGICAIEDDYCSFKYSDGTVEKANAKDLDDRCLLWDPSCSGNRALAMDRFFNQTFQQDLMNNECFTQVGPVNTTVSDCNTFNPPDRVSEFQKIRSWMRSQQCVSASAAWAANTTGGSNFSYANAKNWKMSNMDPDSQMAVEMNHQPINWTSGVNPSCCGVCNAYANNVDIYYWPSPNASTSCLSVIGGSVKPLDYGATKVENSINPTETDTTTYWGCNPRTSTFYNPMLGKSVTYTAAITTAQITTVGSLSVKVPVVNPWSSSPCSESGEISQGSNQSADISNKHAPMRARDHTLIDPSSVIHQNNSAVNTMVSGTFTFTSPSVYANFHGITATDQCGGIIISSTMIAFAPGELETLAGPLALPNQGQLLATESFNINDLPCPPQSVMEKHWYKPEPGEPYRPLIAMPSRVKQIEPWLSYCTEVFFTAYDPPSALKVATALAPPAPKKNPEADPKISVPSLTLVPGARQTVGADPSTPVPASIPKMDQPKATYKAAPIPPAKEGPDHSSQPNHPANQGSPPSQPSPHAVESNSDSKGSSDPQGKDDPQQNADPQRNSAPQPNSDPQQSNNHQQNNDPQQSSGRHQNSDPKQESDPTRASDPKQGSGSSGDPGLDAHSRPSSDPNQKDNSQSSGQSANSVPQMNDPEQSNESSPFNDFAEGQITTINNLEVQPLSHGISVAGTTLTPEAPPITVSGTPIHLGSSALVIGTSTVPLAPKISPPTITTVAGHVITAASNGIAIAGTTLTPGAPPITVSGTPVNFGSSALVIGTSTVPLITPSPTNLITTIAGQAITAAPSAVAIAGTTLSPGASGATIHGTPISLNAAGQLIVKSQTIPLASPVPKTTTMTIAGHAITAAPNAIAMAGTTLQPGAPGTTVDGTLLSLNTASQLIVGTQTIPLESSVPIPMTTTIGGQTITAAPNGIAIAGTSLAPGAPGATVGGTLVSLNTAGEVVVGSKTVALGGDVKSLGGLVLGAFGSGGPFSTGVPSATQGNASAGMVNGTSTGVKVFEGIAARMDSRFGWGKMAVSVMIMVVVLACLC